MLDTGGRHRVGYQRRTASCPPNPRHFDPRAIALVCLACIDFLLLLRLETPLQI